MECIVVVRRRRFGGWCEREQSDGLTSKSLDENLHATAQTQHQVKCWRHEDVPEQRRQ